MHRPKISPAVLKWTRLRARLTEEELSKKAGFSRIESYRAVESGEKQPTQVQLRKLAKALERPVFFFFLNEPPPEPEPLANFRLRPYQEAEATHQEIAAIREAMRRRDLALDAADGL